MNVPGYRIHQVLGRGGMATVYLAQQKCLERLVALKLMLPMLTQEHNNRSVERFTREARLVARLSHPHIVTVFDIGTIGSQPFLAMEYVAGGNLRDRLKQGPLPILQVFSVIRQVASALAGAHNMDIAHRDVKPANILLRECGEVVLSDFGIAKILQGDNVMTALTQMKSLGTPKYMSPEQVRGIPIDCRADQYSLGAVLYECLTGAPPYPGKDAFSVAFKHIYEPVPVLQGEASLFQSLLNRMMAKEPDDRFAEDGDLLAAIDNLKVEFLLGSRSGNRFGKVTDAWGGRALVDAGRSIWGRLSDLLHIVRHSTDGIGAVD